MEPALSASQIPLGPHNATHYGRGWKGYEFFGAVPRRDGIPGPHALCFCGRRRPWTVSPPGGGFAFCRCGLSWSHEGWVDHARHEARPVGVVA